MRKRILYQLLTIFLFLDLSHSNSFAQSACPNVTTGPNISICSGNCTTLSATVQGSVATNSYSVSTIPYSPYPFTGPNPVLVTIDDHWSGVITLPFCFSYCGTNYTKCIIG